MTSWRLTPMLLATHLKKGLPKRVQEPAALAQLNWQDSLSCNKTLGVVGPRRRPAI
jgi:hypothetical protein